MARSYAQLLAFNRGEVSKAALARIDVQKLQLAAQVQLNWMPTVTGAMTLRPGLEYIDEVYQDQPCQLIPFVFSKLDTAQFEVTPNVLRVRVANTLVSRVPVSTVVGDSSMAGSGIWDVSDTTAGCVVSMAGGVATLSAQAVGGIARMKQQIAVLSSDLGKEHGMRFVIDRGPIVVRAGSAAGLQDYLEQATLETGTHSLAFTPTTAIVYLQIESSDVRSKKVSLVSIEPPGPLALPTPWGAGDLASLRYEQSGDVVWIDCAGFQQRRVTRHSTNGFGIELYRPENGPFQDAPGLDMTLLPSVYEGNGTLTASRPYFQPGHVGALFRLFTLGQGNQRTLGAAGAFTEAIRVSGIGNDRVFGWTASGTWTGSLTLQRSLVGADSGFTDVARTTVNGTFSNDDSDTLNNVIAWYRVGFKLGEYGSGAVVVFFGQNVVAPAPVGPTDISAQNTFTSNLAVTGSDIARTFTVHVAGTFSGKVTIQDVTNTLDVATVIGNGAAGLVNGAAADQVVTIDDGRAGTVNYRAGIKTGDYTSGTATITLQQLATGAQGGSVTGGAAALSGGRYGICRVTDYVSPTVVNMEVIEAFSAVVPTDNSVEGYWSDVNGWPCSVCLHEDRLWHFGGERWWGSQTDGYAGYGMSDKWGTSFGDIATITGRFGSGPLDVTSWGVSAQRLLMGREESVESGRSSSFDEPITPTAFTVKTCATDGADRLPALRVDHNVLYVQQSHRRVFELSFSPQKMDYLPRDLTRLNLDVGAQGFVSLAAQRQPDPFLHFVRGGGQSAQLLYQPAEEVECWTRIQTFGVIENVSILPADGLEDRVYFVVRRQVNGVTRRFIERLALRQDCLGGTANQLLDCFVHYSGGATSAVTVAHLPNTELDIWADGAYLGKASTDGSGVVNLPNGTIATEIVAGLTGEVVQASSNTLTGTFSVPSKYEGCPAEIFADINGSGRLTHLGSVSVSGATVTLPNHTSALQVFACIGYVAPFVSAKFAAGAPLGTKRQLDALSLVLYDTHAQGIRFGQSMLALDNLPQMEEGIAVGADTVWPEYDQQAIEVPGDWDADARLVLLAQAPYPVTVGAAIANVDG